MARTRWQDSVMCGVVRGRDGGKRGNSNAAGEWCSLVV